jgi:hypothetical protein
MKTKKLRPQKGNEEKVPLRTGEFQVVKDHSDF